MTSLEERSRIAYTAASAECEKKALDGDSNWNLDFPVALDKLGYELVAFDPSLHCLKLGDPLMAPLPSTDPNPYPYPCLIAPKGWKPDLK